MYTLAKPLFFRTETPMHAGSGNDLGHIVPIQREKHTNFPNVQSSSLKGAFREHIEKNVANSNPEDKISVHLTFGYDGYDIDNDSKNFLIKKKVEITLAA